MLCPEPPQARFKSERRGVRYVPTSPLKNLMVVVAVAITGPRAICGVAAILLTAVVMGGSRCAGVGADQLGRSHSRAESGPLPRFGIVRMMRLIPER
jgi:hypothetical protein